MQNLHVTRLGGSYLELNNFPKKNIVKIGAAFLHSAKYIQRTIWHIFPRIIVEFLHNCWWSMEAPLQSRGNNEHCLSAGEPAAKKVISAWKVIMAPSDFWHARGKTISGHF